MKIFNPLAKSCTKSIGEAYTHHEAQKNQILVEILSSYDQITPHASFYLNPFVYNDHHCYMIIKRSFFSNVILISNQKYKINNSNTVQANRTIFNNSIRLVPTIVTCSTFISKHAQKTTSLFLVR